MKRIALVAGLALVPMLAFADESAVEEEAEAQGLTKREMRMLSGAPTSYAEYRTSYRLARDKMRRAAYADPPPRRMRREADPRLESETPPREDAETYALPEDDGTR